MSDVRPRLAVLVNPTAAHATRVWRTREILARRYQVAFHSPDTAAATSRIAAREIALGATAIVAAGGDGTINCVLRALTDSDVLLGILPLGTANDLARELHLPLDPEAAAERIVNGSARRIDLLDVNGRRFCTVGGTGVVAAAALGVDRWRRRHAITRAAMRPFGAAIYSLFGAANIALARRIEWRIQLAGREAPGGSAVSFRGLVHGMFVANQGRLGASLVLPLAANPADGCFELCLLHAGTRLRLLQVLLALRAGRHPPAGSITVLRLSEAVITGEEPGPFLGDGDDLGASREFQVRVQPGALAVIC